MTRATLLLNPGAGSEQYSEEEIVSMLHKAGYEARCWSTTESEWEKSLKDPGALVVVAGGDGTADQVFTHLVGHQVPVGLLPLGTANNVARTLNLQGSLAQIIQTWNLNNRRPFDIGMAKGPWGEVHFAEAIGMGLFPEMIDYYENHKKQSSEHFSKHPDKMTDPVYLMHQMLPEFRPGYCQLLLDGKDFSGNYLMVHIMNVKAIGPNIVLAPDADPGDGEFDVVLITEKERAKLTDYLANCISGRPAAVEFSVYRGKHIRIVWERLPIQIDGEIWPQEGVNKKKHISSSKVEIEIGIKPGALEVLKSNPEKSK